MAYDVVVFGAHPDDAEMGMGGTIAKLARAGRSVLIVCLTQGERGTHGTRESRQREAAAAAAVLGCEHRMLDFPDAALEYTLEARTRLVQLVRELRPAIVFAPYHANRFGHTDGAAHVDHLATGALVRDAVKLARIRGLEPDLPAHEIQRLYYYMVPRDRYPTLYVDISAELDVLVQALNAYETQMRIERQGAAILDVLLAYRRFHGVGAGCAAAEAFLTEEALRCEVDQLFRL